MREPHYLNASCNRQIWNLVGVHYAYMGSSLLGCVTDDVVSPLQWIFLPTSAILLMGWYIAKLAIGLHTFPCHQGKTSTLSDTDRWLLTSSQVDILHEWQSWNEHGNLMRMQLIQSLRMEEEGEYQRKALTWKSTGILISVHEHPQPSLKLSFKRIWNGFVFVTVLLM